MLDLNAKKMLIDDHGWLNCAIRLHSPHMDERTGHDNNPLHDAVDLLVVHNIALPPGQFGDKYVCALFMGEIAQYGDDHPFLASIANLRVSAHFYINRDGVIYQFVATRKRAWHAGVSCYEKRSHCNDFSIGIELNGGDHTPYTQRQYHALARLTLAIMHRHPAITPARITTHSHIAPGRKTDPGPAFNRHYLQRLLQIY